MRHRRFESTRDHYKRRCGYCGVTEDKAGGELTIDHYRPRAAGGNEEQDNLVYACVRCNQYKGRYWPDEDDLIHNRRVLHPLLDEIAVHVGVDENTGHLYGLTSTGVFHIALLRLNRPQLVAYRSALKLETLLKEKIHLLQRQNAGLQKTILAQERYISFLTGHSKPSGTST